MAKKGKVILINPPHLEFSSGIRGSEWVAPPLGLGYLAGTLLNEGHDVEILDMAVQQLEKKDLERFIKMRNPDIVGVTSTTPAIKKAFNIAKVVKAISSNTFVVLGGPHPTYLPEEAIKEDAVDAIVQGEGETTFLELVNLLLDKSDKRQFVLGTIQKDNGKIINNPPRPLIEDLDSLPFPARHLFRLERYKHPLMKSKKTATILTTRGCPFSCTYCNRGVFGRLYRMRSAKNVIDEIAYLIDTYGIRAIDFIDDNFTMNRRRVEEICGGIREKGLEINWAAPNGISASTLDLELARLMKASGCYSLSFGIESGNKKTLEHIKKNMDLDIVRRAFEICHRVGIETVAFIIIGFPNEDRTDIDNTLRFLDEIKADIVDFHILIPLPGTEIYDELKKKNFILDDDWSKYTFHNIPIFRTEFFSPEEIFGEYKRAYRKFYLRPSYVISRLRRMRSLQEVKNNISGLLTLLDFYSQYITKNENIGSHSGI